MSAATIVPDLDWSATNDLARKKNPCLHIILNFLAPDFYRKLFLKCSDTREWVLRSPGTDLTIPFLNTTGQKGFSYRGAKLWNGLKMLVKQAVSLKDFKIQLLTKDSF